MQSPARTQGGNWPRRANKREASVLNKFAKQMQSVLWDFSRDGGAQGDISFGVKLPANAVVTNVYSDEQTAFAGATSTITLKAGSTALTGAIDFTASSGNNSQALASSATAIKLAAASELKITIATANATAGKIRFAVEWHLSE